MPWVFHTAGSELAPVRIGGVNVWKHSWQHDGGRVEVVDPRYGQRFLFDIWCITAKEQKTRFVAGEFSNGVWGFYIEE